MRFMLEMAHMMATMEADMDPLDAYMSTLEVPDDSAQASNDADWASVRQNRQVRAVDPRIHAKNRRFQRLQQLLAAQASAGSDWYFSDAAMQKRSPALFHFHLGQYMATQGPKPGGDSAPQMALSAFLLSTCDRQDMEARRQQEERTWGAYEAEDHAEEVKRRQLFALFQGHNVEEEEEKDDEEADDATSDEESKEADSRENVSIADRREELIDVMCRRFLDGLDIHDIDYDVIDNDESLDNWDQVERDAEDAYFDDSNSAMTS
ncbi:TPA: hypothetical protein N0F65_000632 [Lagenidium giganteum]|uniref:CCD97-like C-terminal domain-containing protein n=1 Tax=Lagenidium giganteum TaxID=4803 RepID=A0AAV2YJ10_9STRA|nr:TPA: hypothetical protein N0F65_000632 [Lagenidium giganteum]